MRPGSLFFGNFWMSVLFTLLFVGLGISIGYDLKHNSKAAKQEQTESAKQDNLELLSAVSTLQDSIRVLLAKNAQVQRLTPVTKEPPRNEVSPPSLVLAGQSRSMLNGKLLVSVSPHPYDDSTEAEVIIRRVKNPLERAMEYGEVVRLFYAYTGRQESFQFDGKTYLIDFIQVGKIDQKVGVKFALYEK